MPWVDIGLFGSFQRGTTLSAEDPLTEIWARLQHIGTTARLGAQEPRSHDVDWPKHVAYATMRVRQAVEFRAAAKVATPLTAPVNAYYCMLNLLRAIMAIQPERIPSARHGLRFREGDDLFACSAEVTQGTFSEYLESIGERAPEGGVSLGLCLRQVVEIAQHTASSTCLGPSLVAPVHVNVWRDGRVEVGFIAEFVADLKDEQEWEAAFPSLMAACEKEPGAPVLRTQIKPDGTGTTFASEFCERHFLPDLRVLPHARWFVVRAEPGPRLPRAAAYFVAMFILSNICRYEPERLRSVMEFASEDEWIVRRFLDASDRYFGQLMLSWAYGQTLLLGAA